MQMSNFSIVPKENPIDRAYHKLVLDFSLPHRPQLGQQQWVPTLLLVDFTLRGPLLAQSVVVSTRDKVKM